MKGAVVLFSTLPRELTQEDSYGVFNSSWTEPIDLYNYPSYQKELLSKYCLFPFIETESELSPAIGVICTGRDWVKIEGYEDPVFAPGFSWKEEVIPDDIKKIILTT